MKLRAYFDEYCVNIAAFARKIGKSKDYIYQILHGRIPKAVDALTIEKATEGKVTKEELLFPVEQEAPIVYEINRKKDGHKPSGEE